MNLLNQEIQAIQNTLAKLNKEKEKLPVNHPRRIQVDKNIGLLNDQLKERLERERL